MSKNNYIIFFIILVFYGCATRPNNYDKIDEFVQQHNAKLNITQFDCITVLNDQGTCMNCNRSFAIEMGKHIEQDDVLYIVSSSGANIDISAFLEEQGKDNVILDFNNDFSKLNIIEHPAIILLGENKIDTIIEIQLENINENLNNFTSTIEKRF